MPTPRRTLAAIMFTDMVDYTALMAESEEQAIRARRRHGEIVPKLVRRYGGKTVERRGDETLSTFPNALDAVHCALSVQEAVADDRDLSLRIGIHLGDTVFEEGHVYGDGVNIAARIRPLADPGTVCVSGEVWNAVRNHRGLEAAPLGERELRNVGRPVPVFLVSGTPASPTDGELSTPARATPPPFETTDGAAASPDRFVGRERELSELDAALDEVDTGHGRLFFFVGEPGIGKTRLAEEAATAAARRGAHVLWGRAWESEGAPSYWPWIQILRGLLENGEPDALRERIGTGLSYLTQLLPELKETVPDGTGTTTGATASDPARQRFHLFDAVTRFVRNTVADRPHLFVLDDLQWADPPSLLLLRFLAREIKPAPVLIVGTYRDVEARSQKHVSDILSSLAREGQIVHLGGLSEPEVARLVVAWDRERASNDLVSDVYRATEGNPFFVEGILRLLVAAPRDGERGAHARLPIPDEVRGAVRQRLAPLSQQLRELLTIGAVLGREFEQGALVIVSGHAPETVVSLLAEARGLGILAETPIPYRGRFAHDLFREVLYGDLSPTERMKRHAGAGEALESFYGEGAETHAAELALHFFSALPLGEAERAIAYGKLAARRAMSSYAWEDAVHELDRVLAVLGSDPAASERERLGLLLDLGEAVWHSEDPERYRDIFGEAIALARKLSLPRELARAVLGSIGSGPPLGMVDEPKVALLEEALAVVGEDDLILRGRLLVQLAWQTYFSTDRDRRRTAGESVIVARRAGEPTLLVHALRRQHTALLGSSQDLPERIAVAGEMLDAARRSGDPEVILFAQLARIIDCLETGDIAALDAGLDSYSRGANEVREPFHFWFSTALQATRALMAGRWEDAERLSGEALSTGLAVQPNNATGTYGVHQYQLHYEQGRIANLVPAIRGSIDASPKLPSWRAAMALACSELGREREARAELEAVFSGGIESLPTDYMLPAMLMQLSRVASFLGDVPRAEQVYAKLQGFSGRSIVIGYGAACTGAADGMLGLLAGAMSRWDDAIRHFEAALEMNRRMGMGPTVARTQYDYGSMLLRRGEPDDARDAESLLREAVGGARHFGMARLLEQAEETLATLEAREHDRSSGSIALLRREGDYWTVGWQGKSFRLRHLKGFGYIQRLIAEAGRELHCVDVLGIGTVDLGDAGEVLDAGAKGAYRRRLEDLREEIAEAESNNDAGRAAKAREEMELLGQELSSAVGFGGRDRRAARNLERARIRLTRAIRDGIARIRKHDESLGHHLSTAIKTGTFCSYTPDPTSPVTWVTS